MGPLHINNKIILNIMDKEKVEIVLSLIDKRIENGEFDSKLDIPFASRGLLKSLIESKIAKKVETNSTPMLSENEIDQCVKDVVETAMSTAAVFLKVGVLVKTENGIEVSEAWKKFLEKR
jgi:hypothetical protein